MSDHTVADIDAGRNLESIVDSNNKYSYTYDETGIRTSKTVNGKTTYYNTKDGVILSQTDGTDTLYFQYDNTGSPLGFIWNDTQYLYLTNQMGDVISITDAQGIELVQYEYDAWGKCVSTVTAQDNIYNCIKKTKNARNYYGKNNSSYKKILKYNVVICSLACVTQIVSYLIGRRYARQATDVLMYYMIKMRTYSICGMVINIGEIISGRSVVYVKRVRSNRLV